MKNASKVTGVILCMLLWIGSAYGQNLVVNPSFENTANGCAGVPFPTEGFGDLNDWDNANSNTAGDSCSSPDLFSTCNSGLVGILGVPNNNFGYQQARTGDKYAGIITYDASSSTYREYVQGHTSTPLTAGQTYCVSLYVSCPNSTPYATNNMGIYFSNTHYLRDACVSALINVTPQLNYGCAAITDTTNWVRLQWDYVATGGEQYFVIGNFYNNAGTTIANTGNGGFPPLPFAYYFLEDVSIVPNTCCYADINPVSTLCVTDAPVTLAAVAPTSGATCTTAAVTGTWSGTGITNAATGAFDPSVAGPGTHTITFNLSCGATATTNITVSPCVALAVCVESNGDLTASNGVAPYSWQNQTTTQDCSACLFGCTLPPNCAVNVTTWTTFTTGTTIPAPTTFPVQVIDNAGGSLIINSVASLPACTSNPCPTITISTTSQTNVACFGGSTGTAQVTASGGAPGYTYGWTPGNLVGQAQSNLAAGTYTVSVVDNNGCTGSGTVTITQPASALSLSTSTTPADCGASNGSATVTATGGTSGYTYAWSPSGGTGATANNLSSGGYTVTVTDGNGCTATANANVSANGGPTLTIGNVVNAGCFGANGGSATVTATGGAGGYTYAWSPSGGNAATASNLAAGTYTVTVTDASGCVVSETVTITGGTQMTITGNVTDENCGAADGQIAASVTGGAGGYTYAWSPSGGNAATASNLSTGSYTLTVTDANGCTVTQSFTVDVIGGLAVSIVPSTTTITQGDTIQLNATAGLASYSWSPATGLSCTNCADPLAYPGVTTIYTVTATDANGCSGTATVTVHIQPVCGEIYVPTIFSPNNDGNNDQQCVMGECIIDLDFAIYNRWGEVVFRTDDPTTCWDGTYKGKPVNPGVFVYKMYARLSNGEEINESGNLNVVK